MCDLSNGYKITEKETFELHLKSIRTSLLVLFVWKIRTFRFADYI